VYEARPTQQTCCVNALDEVPKETDMKKGKSRRYREAREFKQADHLEPIEELLNGPAETQSESCDECQRVPHAQWCMADTQ
jgi:hypothetical protein